MSENKSMITWYAHVAEIVDRIVVESLKSPEMHDKAMRITGDDPDVVDQFKKHLLSASTTASAVSIEQQKVLRERLSKYKNGDALAELIIGIIVAAVNTATVARFENRKREEQHKKNRDAIAVANWDNLSRNACEARAAAKSMINKALTTLIPDYEYPAEIRTF
jgi:hypothetical protein